MLLAKLELGHATTYLAIALNIRTSIAVSGFALLLILLQVSCYNTANVLSLKPARDNTTKKALPVHMELAFLGKYGSTACCEVALQTAKTNSVRETGHKRVQESGMRSHPRATDCFTAIQVGAYASLRKVHFANCTVADKRLRT